MKQAVLITAYKNPGHLLRIVEQFDESFHFYIHIDKKSQLNSTELMRLKSNKKIRYFSRHYTTNWGGTAHLRSILHLMKKALQDNEADYLHLISGLDFPIKSPAYFRDFLTRHNGNEFIEVFPMPATVWENGGMDRLKYFHLNDWLDAKGKRSGWLHKVLNLQKKLNLSRNLDFKGMALYGGSTWWSLSKACCRHVDAFLNANPWFLKKFNHTFCAEEMLFQTIIMNSPFKNATTNSNLRHIVWEFRHGNIPAVLDERDLETIKNSAHLFARRFDYPHSETLLKHLA
jgi:hypothetical protein